MIPLAVPNIGRLEGKYLQACVDENYVSSVGRFVDQFEQEVARVSGTTQAAATGSGTQGLHLALRAVGVRSGDLVILPSFTFIASANAVAHCGASPWLFDIDVESWTLDPNQVMHALKTEVVQKDGINVHVASGRRVAAIMPVYTLGTIARMDELGQIARRFNIPLVADAAAAIGASTCGKPIGQLADLTVYSFNGNKTITTGGGGAVVGPNPSLVKRVKHLSSTARISANYDHDDVGFNYRMTNLEAAVGCAQMQRLNGFIDAKRRIRERYDSTFAGINGVSLFPKPIKNEGVFWFSGLVIEDPTLPDVAYICDHLRKEGIEARSFWKPIHLQKPYLDAPCQNVDLTDGLWPRVLTLPCSTSLTEDQQQHVISVLASILK